jgi:hypothetical protein
LLSAFEEDRARRKLAGGESARPLKWMVAKGPDLFASCGF